MDAERWRRVDELLQAALQVPAEQQEEFLRQQCGGDSTLLDEVRSLLTSDRKAGSFLESPGLHVADVAVQLPALGVSQLGSSSSITGQRSDLGFRSFPRRFRNCAEPWANRFGRDADSRRSLRVDVVRLT
jgi:hypothetical protein